MPATAAEPTKGNKQPTSTKGNLTPRAARFAELVAGGNSYADAYRQAYKQPHLLPPDAAHRGHKVMKQPQVTARVHELQGKSQGKTLLSLNDRLAILSEIAKEKSAPKSDRIRAVDVYSRIAGDMAPSKMEISGPEGQPIQQQQVAAMPVRQRLAALTAALEAGR